MKLFFIFMALIGSITSPLLIIGGLVTLDAGMISLGIISAIFTIMYFVILTD